MDITKTEMLHGLYGSQISRKHAIGFCKCHNAALTVKTLKKHECLGKQCNALKKYEDHDYWRQREVMRARKKANKQGGVYQC